MIYESLGKNNIASIYYLKLINQYPESDYTASANIKIHILD
jgi:outer membrane protein assembly factor BamD (BamD/ComL family)